MCRQAVSNFVPGVAGVGTRKLGEPDPNVNYKGDNPLLAAH